jgi:hypothetical protein
MGRQKNVNRSGKCQLLSIYMARNGRVLVGYKYVLARFSGCTYSNVINNEIADLTMIFYRYVLS